MKSRHALFLALVLTMLIGINVFFWQETASGERKQITVQRAIDGDTLETTDGETLRLMNINTPEKTQKGYGEARAFLQSLENRSVEIEITGLDTYSRTLARVYAPEYVNLKIVEQGLGKKFLVDESELSLFAEAEEGAIKKEKGLWKKSTYFSCFESTIDQENEKVVLDSSCGEINLKDWILEDESRKQYIFSQTINNKLTFYSEEGKDNATTIYWNQKQSVWNNDRDTLYLFDADGDLAHHHQYGY